MAGRVTEESIQLVLPQLLSIYFLRVLLSCNFLISVDNLILSTLHLLPIRQHQWAMLRPPILHSQFVNDYGFTVVGQWRSLPVDVLVVAVPDHLT